MRLTCILILMMQLLAPSVLAGAVLPTVFDADAVHLVNDMPIASERPHQPPEVPDCAEQECDGDEGQIDRCDGMVLNHAHRHVCEPFGMDPQAALATRPLPPQD